MTPDYDEGSLGESLAFENPMPGTYLPSVPNDNLHQRMNNLESAFLTFSQASSSRLARIEKGLEDMMMLFQQAQKQQMLLLNAQNQPVAAHSSTAQQQQQQQQPSSVDSPTCSMDDNTTTSGCFIEPAQPTHKQQQQQQQQRCSSPSVDLSMVSFTSPPQSPQEEDNLQPRLVFCNVEKKWYTKRPLPEFEIRLVSGKNVDSVITNTPRHEVRLRLLSGTGSYVDHFLHTPTLHFPLVNGRVVISNIRFSAVSSRNGGFFQFEASLAAPVDAQVTSGKSHEIRVLSERLKNEPKAENIGELTGEDSLVRVPGIGKKYAARFRELGFNSVRDLAAIQGSDIVVAKRRRELLEAVRKDRGALTEAKLNELIKDAQTVVDKDNQRVLEDDEHNHASSHDESDHGDSHHHNDANTGFDQPQQLQFPPQSQQFYFNSFTNALPQSLPVVYPLPTNLNNHKRHQPQQLDGQSFPASQDEDGYLHASKRARTNSPPPSLSPFAQTLIAPKCLSYDPQAEATSLSALEPEFNIETMLNLTASTTTQPIF